MFFPTKELIMQVQKGRATSGGEGVGGILLIHWNTISSVERTFSSTMFTYKNSFLFYIILNFQKTLKLALACVQPHPPLSSDFSEGRGWLYTG